MFLKLVTNPYRSANFLFHKSVITLHVGCLGQLFHRYHSKNYSYILNMGAFASSHRAHMQAVIDPPLTLLENEYKLPNPGSLDEIHKKCKEIFPINFEGGKLIVNRGISNHFQISHTINMSSISPSGYKIGGTFVGTKQTSPTEAFPVVLGDVDPDGNINCNVIHQFTPEVKCRFLGQVQAAKIAAIQLTTEYRGDYHTAALTLGSQEMHERSYVAVGHYLQSVTNRLALGAELAYQRNPKIPGGEIAVVSAAGRYTMSDSEVSGTLGMGGLHVCYYKQASEQVQIGVELETSLRGQESVGTIGYQVQLPKADLVFKGMIDSNWTVGATLEKRLQPLPFSFALSGSVNHTKQQFRFGCGVIIG